MAVGTIYSSPEAGWVRVKNPEILGWNHSAGNGYWIQDDTMMTASTIGAVATLSGVSGVSTIRIMFCKDMTASRADVYYNGVKAGSIVGGSGETVCVYEDLTLDPNIEYEIKVITTAAVNTNMYCMDFKYSYVAGSTVPATGWTKIDDLNTSVIKYIGTGWTLNSYNGGWTNDAVAYTRTIDDGFKFSKPIKGLTGIAIFGFTTRNGTTTATQRCSRADVYLNGVFKASFSTISPVAVGFARYWYIDGLDANTEYTLEVVNVSGGSLVLDAIDIQGIEFKLPGMGLSLVDPEAGWVRYDSSDENYFNITRPGIGKDTNALYYNGTLSYWGVTTAHVSNKRVSGISAVRIIGRNCTNSSPDGIGAVYLNGVLHGYMLQTRTVAGMIYRSFDYEITGLDPLQEYVVKIMYVSGNRVCVDAFDFIGTPSFRLGLDDVTPEEAPMTGYSRMVCKNSLLYYKNTKIYDSLKWTFATQTNATGGFYIDNNNATKCEFYTRAPITGITGFYICTYLLVGNNGVANVYLNGELIGTITESTSTTRYDWVVFAKDGLDPETEYTIRVEVVSGLFSFSHMDFKGTVVYDTTLPSRDVALTTPQDGWTRLSALTDVNMSYFGGTWQNGGTFKNTTNYCCVAHSATYKNISGIRIIGGNNAASRLQLYINGEFQEVFLPTTGVYDLLVFEKLGLDPNTEYQIEILNFSGSAMYLTAIDVLGTPTIVDNIMRYPILKSTHMVNIPSGWLRYDYNGEYIKTDGTWANPNSPSYWAGSASYTATVGPSVAKTVMVTGISKFVIGEVQNSDRQDGDLFVLLDDVLDGTGSSYNLSVVGHGVSYVRGGLDPSKSYKITVYKGASAGEYIQPDALDFFGPAPKVINLNIIGIIIKNTSGYLMKYDSVNKTLTPSTFTDMRDDVLVYSKSAIANDILPIIMGMSPELRPTLEVYDLTSVTKLGILYEGENWCSESIFSEPLSYAEICNDNNQYLDQSSTLGTGETYVPNEFYYGTSNFTSKIINDDLNIANSLKEIAVNTPAEIDVRLPIAIGETISDECTIVVSAMNDGIDYVTPQEEYVYIQGLTEARADFFLSTTEVGGNKFKVKDIIANIDDFIEIKFDTNFDAIVCPDFLSVNNTNSAISGILSNSGTYIITGTREGEDFKVNLTVNKLKRIM